MTKDIAIGVDLGGTNIRGILVDAKGVIINQLKCRSQVKRGKEIAIRKLLDLIQKLIAQSVSSGHLIGIGVGAPGPLDVKKGIIHFAPNLPGWKEVYLKKILKDKFNMKVVLENDANAAAWGERCFGAGKGINNLVCFTLGTGIGGGIIIDGKIYHGNNFVSAEFGHMTVNKDGPLCNCGNRGCLEAYSSATGIRNRIKDKIKKGITSQFFTNIDDYLNESVGLKSIFESARMGDDLTKNIIEDAITYLGIAMANIANLLNPEMIILTGGITNEGENLMIPLKKEVKKRTLSSNYQFLKIVTGELGDFAGTLGAAALLFSSHV